ELAGGGDEDVVALRGPHRWIQNWEPVRIEASRTSRLRRDGVYLITGGLGGIALAIAEHLVTAYSSKLVLLARTLRSDRLERIRALEARGAEVLVVEGDVADARQVRAAVDAADARFGRIDGVVHCAGVPGLGMMQWKTSDAARRVFAPKIAGTLALAG